ncbi:MAG TPA: c-type cytochrome domain-containing protein [Planctomycetaceae bacterium]|nr:c-type cytochrome domain-containing protein [Planctomycetaceae bacterium]
MLWLAEPLVALAARPATVSPPARAADKPLDFESAVAPIFKAKCLRCHGESDRKAELDLRTAAAALKGGESGPVVVPNDPDQSLLYEKVRDGEMPPGKKDRLSDDEITAIRRWIEAAHERASKASRRKS